MSCLHAYGYQRKDCRAIWPDVSPIEAMRLRLIDHVFTAGADWTSTAWSADLWSYGDNALPVSDHWAITTDLFLR